MNNQPENGPDARSALRRLLIVLAVVIGIVVYAYGWRVTDIGLEETQDPTRQSSVQRAMRELLSPNLFEQDTTLEEASANFQKECSGAPVEQPPHDDGKPNVQLTPDCGSRDDIVTVEGFGYPANSIARVFLIRPSGERQPFELLGNEGNTAVGIDAHGYFKTQVVIPNIRGDAGSVHQVEVESEVPAGLPRISGTTQVVIQQMIVTVFLALMATTLAVPISVFLSFLAARNLMKEVRLPVGNVLIGFVLLPVGWIVGSVALGAVGKIGVDLGKNLLMGIVGPAAAIVAFAFVSEGVGRMKIKPYSIEGRLRDIGMRIFLLVVAIFTLGAVGGIGMWLGSRLSNGPLSDIGNFVGTLGRLIELSIVLLAGLAGAFYVSSLGTGLTGNLLKGVRGIPGYVAGGALGAVSGALLLAGMGVIGRLAALLTVVPPVVAAVIGSAIIARLYKLGTAEFQRRRVGATESALVSLIGAAATFIVTAHILDVLHLIVIGRLPAEDFIAISAIIGAVLGGIGGLLAGIHAWFPMGDVIYNVTRTILNALRSIEPLIMGIVFVIWVSIGPFAGVLALTLHSIASLGKLYSEQIESIDPGPIEAIQSTGATRLQTIVYAVVPQIVPPYIAFTMYRWDINVRMSTIIGFVGGGGIGFLLQQQINLLRYSEAGVAVLAIAVVVSVLDYASASIRERLI